MELVLSGRSLINIMKRMCHNTEPWKMGGGMLVGAVYTRQHGVGGGGRF